MDFLILNLYLCIMCVPALLILRFCQKRLMSSIASFFILAHPEREPENKSMFAAIAAVGLSVIAFLYLAVAWSAYCVAITQSIISREAVTWDWLYLSVSFLWCVQILLRSTNLSTLYQRVTTETLAVWDQAVYTFQFTLAAGFIICGLAALAWILFAIWTGLMLIPYGWALNPIIYGADTINDFLKTNWWIPVIILFAAIIKIVFIRPVESKFGWEAEIEKVVSMTQRFSEDWVGYRKSEFLEKMPETWIGATAEDRGTYVVVRNLELYKYFEFHMMFSEQQNATMDCLIVHGLHELDGLRIFGRYGKLTTSLRAVSGNSVSHDAKKAITMMEKKHGVPYAAKSPI